MAELNDKELKDFNDIVQNTLSSLIDCADKHNISEICRHDLAMNLSRADDFCSYAKMKGVQ